jgi:hypothetical protein
LWSEDVFNSAKTIYQHFGEFIKEVSDEFGTDKAIELFLKPWEREAQASAKRRKESEEINLKNFSNHIVNNFIKMGYQRSAEVTPTTITYTTKKCPHYQGFIEAGLSHEIIEAICIGIANAYDEELKEQLDPKAGYKIKFRASEDDVCVEEIILKP